jgi:integrase
MDALNKFKYYLLRQGKRQSTVQKHINALTYIYENCHTFDPEKVEGFLFSLYEQGRTGGYLNILVQALRHYGRSIKSSKYDNIKYFKVVETFKNTLSDDEITDLLSITADAIKYLRDPEKFNRFTFFFRILSFTGLRPNELLTMRCTQVDFGEGVFRLDHTTKTSTPRTVAINDLLITDLRNYIKDINSEYLFPQTWDRHTWKEQFNLRIRYLGIKREKLSTYSIRFSWVSRLLDAGVNSIVLAEMAGHSLEQQKHYYRMTTKSKKIAIKKDPLGRKLLTPTERMTLRRKLLEDAGCTVVKMEQVGEKYIYEVVEN